ncbi:NADH:flavin oxidoreductase/NADH oxidase family protein [Streptococcus agalactiae]|nr:NADH:flavin oxidoreductase/NADH oxidase family protein [Streptococcus agalactiae]
MMLFEQVTLPNGQVLKNRIAKAALSETLAEKDFQPNTKHINLYRQWALGGTGLLISGNVMVDRNHISEPGNVVVDEETDRYILEQWADAGRLDNTQFILQLNHPGKQTPKSMTKSPVAPSAVELGDDLKAFFNPARALETSEISQIVDKFVTASKIAYETGFSGVEIHAAHGYLINQFLSPADNKRTDQYGGSLENRMRILVEIYQGIRAVTPADFIVGLKINSTDFSAKGFSEEDSKQVILKMADLGIDFVEISGGNYEKTVFMDSNSGGAFFLDFAKSVQSQVTIPIILTGGLTNPQAMEEVVAKEGIQMVGLARALVVNPNLPNDIKAGKAEPIHLARLTTGFKGLDKKLGGAIGLSHYELQIKRLAAGKDVKVTKNAWPAILEMVAKHGTSALKPRRR